MTEVKFKNGKTGQLSNPKGNSYLFGLLDFTSRTINIDNQEEEVLDFGKGNTGSQLFVKHSNGERVRYYEWKGTYYDHAELAAYLKNNKKDAAAYYNSFPGYKKYGIVFTEDSPGLQ